MSNVRKTGSIGMFRNEFVEAGTTGTQDVTNDGVSVDEGGLDVEIAGDGY
jgi:hypothetical protein